MKEEILLKKLIQIKSYSGQEDKLAEFIRDYGKTFGLSAHFVDNNVVYHFIGKNQKKCLIFNAHMDTVKAGDLHLWRYPPYGKNAGVVKAGRMFGLGASDAKVGIACLLLLIEKLSLAKPPCDVWFSFVVNEETNGSGTKCFLGWFNNKFKEKYKEIDAVVAEPTDLKKIEIGHKGNVFVKITVRGDSGHSARPERIEKHAVELMVEVIAQIKLLEQKLKEDFLDKLFGAPSICLTGIGTPEESKNKVPGVCWSTWDIRTTPQLHKMLAEVLPSKWVDTFSQWWDKINKSRSKKDNFQIELLHSSPYGVTREDEKIVKIVKQVVPKAKISFSSASNDLGYFSQSEIPAVVFGPGKKQVIHKENEYVEVRETIECAEIYKQVIDRFEK